MSAVGPVHAGEGALRVAATALPAGPDWVVLVEGGEAPHVGAVALACPCDPPPNTSGAIDSYAGVLTAPGHRDDLLARELALRVCKALRRNVSLSVGIHVHNAGLDQIEALMRHARAAVDALVQEIQLPT